MLQNLGLLLFIVFATIQLLPARYICKTKSESRFLRWKLLSYGNSFNIALWKHKEDNGKTTEKDLSEKIAIISPAHFCTHRWPARQYWRYCNNWRVIQLAKDYSELSEPTHAGTTFILNAVLPVLIQLIKTFQRGSVSFTRIQPAIEACQAEVEQLAKEIMPLKTLNLL